MPGTRPGMTLLSNAPAKNLPVIVLLNSPCDDLVRGMNRIFQTMIFRAVAALLLSLAVIPSAFAAKCGGSFPAFIADFSRDAAAKGISQDVLSASLGSVTE